MTRSLPRAARRLATALALTLLATRAGGQSVAQAVTHDFLAAGSDVWWVWTSPFHASARDWRDLGAVLAGGALISTTDERVDRWVVRHRGQGVVRAFSPPQDEHGFQPIDAATANALLPLSGGLYLAGLASGQRGLRDAGMGCAASQQSDAIIRGLVYTVVERDRPRIAGGDAFRFAVPGGGWNKHSFFAGHVANAMACASFFDHRFRLGAPGKLLYAGAAAIGLGRMADRQHWASDTFIGASFGYAVGRTVARRQRRRLGREARAPRQSLLDRAMEGAYVGAATERGMALGWQARF